MEYKESLNSNFSKDCMSDLAHFDNIKCSLPFSLQQTYFNHKQSNFILPMAPVP